jgi:multidrug resistance efflux pump
MLLVLISLDAAEYYAKAEPKELFSVKSSVSGEVIFVHDIQEGADSDGSVIIKIDDVIDKADLESSKLKLKYLLSNIALMKQNLANSKKIVQINNDNYSRVKNLSTYSKTQKDIKLLSMINAQSSYISLKTSLENLKTQKEDLKLKIKILKDRIKKKNIAALNGQYIYKIYPRSGDYVNPGSKLMDLYDTSEAKLVIYVSADDLLGIEKKKIYLDGNESAVRIEKIWRVADSVNISSYRVEILIDKPKQFSKLVKIEFK